MKFGQIDWKWVRTWDWSFGSFIRMIVIYEGTSLRCDGLLNDVAVTQISVQQPSKGVRFVSES